MNNNTLEVDLLLLGGKILRSDQKFDERDAIALNHGRIVAIGRVEDLRDINAKETIRIDGKYISPGFIDAHCHFILYCMALRLVDCRTSLNGDINEILERLVHRVNEIHPGQWIKGWGYADYKIDQRRFPSKEELDNVAPNNPLAIIHTSWHSAVLNSLGLKELGITSRTPDPPGGYIERDPDTGEPNGLIHETAMQKVSFESMIEEFVSLKVDEQMDAIQIGSEEFARFGLTSTCDAMVYPSFFPIYLEADKRRLLKFRVQAMPFYDKSQAILKSGLTSGFGSEKLKLGPIKLLGDGSLSGRTAAVSEPFVDGSDLGILIRDQKTINKIVQELNNKGYRISIHAIGDRAVRQVIHAFQNVITKCGRQNRRHRIEHAGVLNPELIHQMANVDLVVVTQPRMLFEQGDVFYKSCGKERIQWVYPYRSLIRSGLHVAGSSDCPVVSPNPLLGMRDAVMRTTEEGRVLAPEECLEPYSAFRMFTEEGAYALCEENIKGSLEVGKLADLVILSGDILNTPPKTWGKDIRVEMTIVGGEIVYNNLNGHQTRF